MSKTMPIEQRSTGNLILIFVVVPFVLGPVILTFTVLHAVENARNFAFFDWIFQFVWPSVLGLGIMTAAPATAVLELNRRWQGGGIPDAQELATLDSDCINGAAEYQNPNGDLRSELNTAPSAADASLALRILAVAYVLSPMLQFLGFLLLSGIGSFLWITRGFDGWAVGFWLSAIGCLVLGVSFRWMVQAIRPRH